MGWVCDWCKSENSVDSIDECWYCKNKRSGREEMKKDENGLEANEKIRIVKEEYDVKINKLEGCLRDKDKRLKKIEERYSNIVWSFILVGIVVLGLLLLATIHHIYNNIENMGKWNSYAIYTVNDVWLLVGMLVVSTLAIIGFGELLYLFYLWLRGDKK